MTAGVTSTATCALDETAISDARRRFPPRRASTTAPPCSAALPTIATITIETKNCDRCTSCANVFSEWTRISLTKAVSAVAAASAPSVTGRLHAPSGSAPLSRCCSRCRRRPHVVTTT